MLYFFKIIVTCCLGRYVLRTRNRGNSSKWYGICVTVVYLLKSSHFHKWRQHNLRSCTSEDRLHLLQKVMQRSSDTICSPQNLFFTVCFLLFQILLGVFGFWFFPLNVPINYTFKANRILVVWLVQPLWLFQTTSTQPCFNHIFIRN